jgi:hypothetical protein
MKSVHSILLAFTIVTALPAAGPDAAERKVLVDHLNQSSSEFADSLKGLTTAQWNYKPAPEVWSIAECAEHIALTEDLLRGMVENKVLATAPKTREAAERKPLDEKVLKMITDRSTKAKAPEMLQPSRQFATPAAALQKFEASRKQTLTLANSRSDLRDHTAPHPVLKELDAYQWLLYLSGHTMRHTAQIREVKASPGYPAAE